MHRIGKFGTVNQHVAIDEYRDVLAHGTLVIDNITSHGGVLTEVGIKHLAHGLTVGIGGHAIDVPT
jgi:hypothetical protein